MERKLVILLTLLYITLAKQNLRAEDIGRRVKPYPQNNPHDSPDDHFPGPWNRSPPQNNTRPVIGVLTLPIHPYEDWDTNASTYVASSYVKFIEMGGARVVPIRIDQSFENLDFLFSRINGILFTGGDANFWVNETDPVPTLSSDYGEKACYLYNKVKQTNDAGNYFPLWGTCLGFEIIQVCEQNNYETLGHYNGSPPYVQSHDFTQDAERSYLFNSISPKYGRMIRRVMAEKKTSLLSHTQGVSPTTYQGENNLTATFNVLSTMLDKSGNRFVGIIEAKKYPIFATQFHPEKNIYEWDPNVPQPHDHWSIQVSTYFASFLVTESRRNTNSFASEEELAPYLIYNWWPLFTNGYFTQTYEFQ